ncbi:MAG: AI-2E family transporter [Oscillospiraceae bacterium]|jgi:predicted PurR-regulated permease PerM|nr:AI-2E family transporter [Oscillospiraceae bacterium]
MKKRFRWNLQYLYWGITALCVIVAGLACFFIASRWRTGLAWLRELMRILSPVIYGLVLTYLLNKPMNFFENRIYGRLKGKTAERGARKRRILSLLSTMVFALLLIGGALALLLPQIYTSIQSLISQLPGYFTKAMEWARRLLDDNPDLERTVINLVGNIEESLTEWLKTTLLAQVNTIVTNLTSGVIGAVREVINLLIGFVVAVYLLYHRETFAAQVKKLLYAVLRPRFATGALRGLRFLDYTCGSFVTSRLIDALIVGVVCWIAMTIARIPYAVLISVLVGVTNIIPFFGPFIGGVPSALLLLLENPTKGLIFVIIVVVLQQLDGNVLYPRIQGTSLGLSGFWILFAILLFGGLMGFWGFLLGVPIFAVIYHALRWLARALLSSRGLPTETEAYAGGVEYGAEDAEAAVEPVAETDARDDEET